MSKLAVKKASPSSPQVIPMSQRKAESKPIIADKVKTRINIGFNGIAAVSNLITFLNGNFFHIEALQEIMEKLSGAITKLATGIQGVVNASIAFEKKNIVALIGGAAELPIALLTSGYNLYLARGVSAGLNHFDSIISRTKKLKENGTVALDETGNELYYDNFRKEGWFEGLKILMKHIPKLTKELYEKPFERSGLFPRSFFLCSLFMILGPIIALVHEKTGAVVRHLFGGLAGIALATDLKKSANISTSTKKTESTQDRKQKGLSNYAISGILWVLAAIPDVLKRFDFISSKINNGTEIALCLDRLAGIFFIFGNQGTEDKKPHIGVKLLA